MTSPAHEPVTSRLHHSQMHPRCAGSDCHLPAVDPPTVRLLHHTDQRLPIAQIPAGTWCWDDVNGEPFLLHGWESTPGLGGQGSYVGEWLNHGRFHLWELNGAHEPTVLEILAVQEEQETADA